MEFFNEGDTTPYKSANYYFDSIGRRMAKVVVDQNNLDDKVKSFTRYFAYDNQEIIAAFDKNKSLLARYTHSGLRTDDVLAIDVTMAGVTSKVAQTMGSFYYLKDHLGTIKHIADSTGNIIQTINYSAYGVITSIKDSLNNSLVTPPLEVYHSFTGREYDRETGNYYYRARFYSADTGRFLQQDPDPGRTDFPQSFVNKYSYVANNPYNLRDASGMNFWDSIMGRIVIAAGALVLGGATLGAALGAIAAAALGAAVMGGVMSVASGGKISWADAFESIFKSSLAILTVGGLIGAVTGGFEYVGPSKYGLQGQVVIKNYGPGFTFGSSSFMGPSIIGGPGHELGHTIQQIAFASIGGGLYSQGKINDPLDWAAGAYLLWGIGGGAAGRINQYFGGAYDAWWNIPESTATYIGN